MTYFEGNTLAFGALALILTRFRPGERGITGLLSTVSTVFLIAPFQTVPLNKDLILLRKTSLSVMFFLARNVVSNPTHIRMRD